MSPSDDYLVDKQFSQFDSHRFKRNIHLNYISISQIKFGVYDSRNYNVNPESNLKLYTSIVSKHKY